MKVYAFTPAATEDLFEIWSFIAEDNIEAADRVEADILASCRTLASNPDIGHRRSDLTSREVLFYTVRGTYLIVFDPPRHLFRFFEFCTAPGMSVMNCANSR